MVIEAGDSVVVEFTGRTADGTVFDTSREAVAEEAGLTEVQPDREFGPLTVEVGAGQVIEGLEDSLIGLEDGASPTVTVPPEKAYGEWREEHVHEYDAEEFDEIVGDQTPAAGDYVQTEDGGLAEIVHADDDVVRVDFNHELAGERLEFDVEIVEVR